jgi:hypothetical protein
MATAEEAKEVVEEMTMTAEHRSSAHRRHVFDFNGTVHAHRLPNDWEFVGLGPGWFAIREE